MAEYINGLTIGESKTKRQFFQCLDFLVVSSSITFKYVNDSLINLKACILDSTEILSNLAANAVSKTQKQIVA